MPTALTRHLIAALSLGGLALAAACDRTAAPRADVEPSVDDISAATIRDLSSREPPTACDQVAHHAARVIQGYFAELATSLTAADRDDWMADIRARFDEGSLAERCEARQRHADFVEATTCVAGATSLTQIMQCNLWQAGAA